MYVRSYILYTGSQISCCPCLPNSFCFHGFLDVVVLMVAQADEAAEKERPPALHFSGFRTNYILKAFISRKDVASNLLVYLFVGFIPTVV